MQGQPGAATPGLRSGLAVSVSVYGLLAGVAVVGDGFKWLSGGAAGAERLFAFATNPLVGVLLGTLATALVQSSSTVTSVIVGLVAGGLPVAAAVPMVMGANMGTAITNTIVSLGSLREQGGTFRRSFEAATVHDFFNLYSVVLFLPLEAAFHPLERAAGALAGWARAGGDLSVHANLVGAATAPVLALLRSAVAPLPGLAGPIVLVLAGIALIVAAVVRLGRILRDALTGRARSLLAAALGRGPLTGVAAGTLVTVLVQSSSTTTSLLVPLAGAGVVPLRQAYPFMLGANLGTCVTALLAATGVSGPAAGAALQVALVHLLFNGLGVGLFLAVPQLRDLPVRSAEWLGRLAEQRRAWALAYVLGLFFVVPGAALAARALLAPPPPAAPHQALEAAEAAVEAAGVAVE